MIQIISTFVETASNGIQTKKLTALHKKKIQQNLPIKFS